MRGKFLALIDRFRKKANRGYHCIAGDLSDPESIERVVEEVQPTHVIHLGALQTPDCRDYPMQGLDINVIGTAHLFQACSKLKSPLQRFVFASSSAVNGARSLYGPEGVRPEDPYHPFNLYGYWKVAGEGMAQAFHQVTGTPTVSLRLATTYGPGRDRGFTAAMTSAMKAVVRGESFEVPYRGQEHYHFSLDVGAGFARRQWILFPDTAFLTYLGKLIRLRILLPLLSRRPFTLKLVSQRLPSLQMLSFLHLFMN